MRPICATVAAFCCLTLLAFCPVCARNIEAASTTYPHLSNLLTNLFPPTVIEKEPHIVPPAAAHSRCISGCGNKIRLVNTADPDHNSVLEDDITTNERLLDEYDVANQLTALRIEYIKRQILKKLRMTEIPSVSVTDLPPQITERNSVDDGYGYSDEADDFYGKTTQAIIYPYEDKARCARKILSPSACLPFKLPNDIKSIDVSSAQLWFHKEPDVYDTHNQTFIVSEIAHWDSNRSFQKRKPIAIQETNLKQGWLKVDVSYVIQNWLTYQDSPTHAINLACKTCGMAISDAPISFAPPFKPFLVIYTKHQTQTGAPVLPLTLPQSPQAAPNPFGVASPNPFGALPNPFAASPNPFAVSPSVQLQASPKRHKRSTICAPGVRDCCREHLYVSFAEIGWDNWIMEPAGYNAYFCKGTCSTAAAVTISASEHNTIIHTLMQRHNDKKATLELELTPCCAATQFKPLQILYADGNKTITSKILPNMIVTQCGCM